jgi:hypothetical protein
MFPAESLAQNWNLSLLDAVNVLVRTNPIIDYKQNYMDFIHHNDYITHLVVVNMFIFDI